MIHGPLVFSVYCLLASPLMVSPSPEVLLRMKYPLPLSTITDTCVLPPPTVVYHAICTYRIGPSNRRRLDIVTVHSYEKLCAEVPFPIEGKAADSSEISDTDNRSPGMQPIAAVQDGV